MSRLQRTPPAMGATDSGLTYVASDSDIPQAICSENNNVNTILRHKRLRSDFSPNSNHAEDKQEFKNLIKAWKTEQDEHVNKLCNQQTVALNKLVSEIVELKLQNSSIQETNLEIKKSMCFMNNQFEVMRQQIELLKQEKQTYKRCINDLETKMQDLQQTSRSSCVEIRNIPTKENETAPDLTSIIKKVGAVVDVTLVDSQIRDVYRLPGKPGTSRPIITEFTSVQTKEQLLSNLRIYNKSRSREQRLNTKNISLAGVQQPVYVAEYLPAASRKLCFKAREFAKINKFMFCWTKNGNIFLRKDTDARYIIVRSEQTLLELEKYE